MWIEESLRHAGAGSGLTTTFEAEARRRGCERVVVSTHEFQAPRFYEKLGYAVYGAVDDYPLGYRHIHLVKVLEP